MRLIIRITLLTVLAVGIPSLLPKGYAISGPQLELQLTTHKKVKEVQKPRLKRDQKARITRQRAFHTRRRHTPAEIFFGGLFMVTVGVLLPLTIKDKESVGFEDALTAIFLSIVGFLAILVGTVTALIGGIMWLAEHWG